MVKPQEALLHERKSTGDLWINFPYSTEYLRVIAAPKETSEGLGNGLGNGKDSIIKKTSVKILDLFRNNPDMTLAEVAVSIGKTKRAIELASSKLVKEGRLRYVGPQKGGHWEVMENGKWRREND
ncbi:MAG: hypothetical protein PHY48_14355 [Candidatus Cloacimonetes bacterium]|nr:hypothetical protein [Candidatus Cloacimonadota bacterium]